MVDVPKKLSQWSALGTHTVQLLRRTLCIDCQPKAIRTTRTSRRGGVDAGNGALPPNLLGTDGKRLSKRSRDGLLFSTGAIPLRTVFLGGY